MSEPPDLPPALPRLHPDLIACGNCASWRGFGSGAGGRCGDARSGRLGNVIARSTDGCPFFCPAAQLELPRI